MVSGGEDFCSPDTSGLQFSSRRLRRISAALSTEPPDSPSAKFNTSLSNCGKRDCKDVREASLMTSGTNGQKIQRAETEHGAALSYATQFSTGRNSSGDPRVQWNGSHESRETSSVLGDNILRQDGTALK